jgi:hypothetical protein
MSFKVLASSMVALCFVVSCSRGSEQTPASSGEAASPAAGTPEAAPPAAADSPAQAPATPADAAPVPESAPPSAAQAPSQSATAAPPPPRRESTAAARPATPAAPAPRAEAAAPPEPRFRELTIPAGTTLHVTLATAVASDKSQIEDEVRGTLARRIVVDGVTVVPAGAEIVGTVRDAKRSGRVKGRASIAFQFERLVVRNEPHSVETALVTREAEADRKDDVTKGAIGGGVGAIVGGIVGGGKGAAIGAAAGGAGTVLATRGDEVRLAPGTRVTTTLRAPVTVVVPVD